MRIGRRGLPLLIVVAVVALSRPVHAADQGDVGIVDDTVRVVAISTVGFGDLTPSSDGSKLFTVLYLAIGIAVVTSFVNARLKSHARDISQRLADSDSPRSDVHRSG